MQDDDSNIARPTYTQIFFIGRMMRWPLHVIIARIAFDSYPSNRNTEGHCNQQFVDLKNVSTLQTLFRVKDYALQRLEYCFISVNKI